MAPLAAGVTETDRVGHDRIMIARIEYGVSVGFSFHSRYPVEYVSTCLLVCVDMPGSCVDMLMYVCMYQET